MEQHGRTTCNPLLLPLTIKPTLYKSVHLPSNKSCISRLCFPAAPSQSASSDCASLEPLYAIHAPTRLWSRLVHFRQVHQTTFPGLTFDIRTWLIRGGMVNLFIYFYFWKVFSSFVGYQRSTQSFPTMFRPRKRGNEIFFFLIFMNSAY